MTWSWPSFIIGVLSALAGLAVVFRVFVWDPEMDEEVGRTIEAVERRRRRR